MSGNLFWGYLVDWNKDIDIIGMDGKRVDHLIGFFNIILKEIAYFDLTIFTKFGIFYTVN